MKRKLSKVSCQFGAPLGRCNVIPDDIKTAGKLYLEKLKWTNGDYTTDGTYWGSNGGDNIFRAYGESETEQIEIFVRANSRDNAKMEVKAVFPEAKFFQ